MKPTELTKGRHSENGKMNKHGALSHAAGLSFLLNPQVALCPQASLLRSLGCLSLTGLCPVCPEILPALPPEDNISLL